MSQETADQSERAPSYQGRDGFELKKAIVLRQFNFEATKFTVSLIGKPWDRNACELGLQDLASLIFELSKPTFKPLPPDVHLKRDLDSTEVWEVVGDGPRRPPRDSVRYQQDPDVFCSEHVELWRALQDEVQHQIDELEEQLGDPASADGIVSIPSAAATVTSVAIAVATEAVSAIEPAAGDEVTTARVDQATCTPGQAATQPNGKRNGRSHGFQPDIGRHRAVAGIVEKHDAEWENGSRFWRQRAILEKICDDLDQADTEFPESWRKGSTPSLNEMKLKSWRDALDLGFKKLVTDKISSSLKMALKYLPAAPLEVFSKSPKSP